MYKNNPEQPGLHIFVGIRTTPSHRIVTVKDVVLVIEDKLYPEYMICHLGTYWRHPVSNYTGKWKYIGSILDFDTDQDS